MNEVMEQYDTKALKIFNSLMAFTLPATTFHSDIILIAFRLNQRRDSLTASILFDFALTLSILSQFYKYHFFHLLNALKCNYLQDEASGVHEFSTMNRQDGHLLFDPKRSSLRSYAYGQLRLQQAKLAIA
jgi:hypothetical protein